MRLFIPSVKFGREDTIPYHLQPSSNWSHNPQSPLYHRLAVADSAFPENRKGSRPCDPKRHCAIVTGSKIRIVLPERTTQK